MFRSGSLWPRGAAILGVLLGLLATASYPAPYAMGAGGLVLEKVLSGFSNPVYLTHSGDGSGRLFVVEKGGLVKIIRNGSVLPQPFLDIQDRVGNSGEAGLLSIAFPPDFATSRYFLVYYNHADKNLLPPAITDNGNNSGFDTVIARFHLSSDPDRADPNSEERILVRNQPFDNHNGGLIGFGPDGYLYIGLGDGGSGGDPLNSGQQLNTILGKLLRIAVGPSGTYSVPASNPFVHTAGALPEIWDFGLRNPWRWSFDRATGDLYIGDVGQNKYEEISFHAADLPGGLNFGWRCKEGLHNYNATPPCAGPLVDPIAEYGHDLGISVTGGYVYRGTANYGLFGKYFYADFGSGRIWSLQHTPTGWSTPEQELDTSYSIASFGEDEAGDLYVVDMSGTIYHMASTANPAPDLGSSTKTASAATVQPGDLVVYTIRLANTGEQVNGTVTVTDRLPSGLTYVPGSLQASGGVADASQAPLLAWRGDMAAGQIVTIDYQASVDPSAAGKLTNTAQVTGRPTMLALSTTITSTPPAAPVADLDFRLPGTQPGHLVDAIANPAGCQACHTDPIYGAWRGSMMAQAGRDPLLWPVLAVANSDVANGGEFCLRCHTPKGWFDGHSHPAGGSALSSDDIAAGVARETCHRMVDPMPAAASDEASVRDTVLREAISPTVPAGNASTGMLILDPLDNRRGPFTINPSPPHPRATWRTALLGQNGDPVIEARVCGTCHNLDNPTLSWDPARGQYWPNAEDAPPPSYAKGELFPIERTYDEWLNSAYATEQGVYAPLFAGSKPDGIVRTCQDCHMPRTIGAPAIGDIVRNCVDNGCLPEHALVGGNTWVPQLLADSRWRLNAVSERDYLDITMRRARAMLQKSATVTVTLADTGANKVATVRVTNESGHKLPTGYPEGRRMWLNLQAYDEAGQLVFSSGVYDPASGILAEDPALKVYEAKQGLTPELAAAAGLPAGASFHFLLNNTIVKDNRIPPRGYTQAGFDQPGLRPVGAGYADGQYWDETSYVLPPAAESVAVTLYYQTASKEYIDFLRTLGEQDGAVVGQLWDDLKSPPEVVAAAITPVRPVFLPSIELGSQP